MRSLCILPVAKRWRMTHRGSFPLLSCNRWNTYGGDSKDCSSEPLARAILLGIPYTWKCVAYLKIVICQVNTKNSTTQQPEMDQLAAELNLLLPYEPKVYNQAAELAFQAIALILVVVIFTSHLAFPICVSFFLICMTSATPHCTLSEANLSHCPHQVSSVAQKWLPSLWILAMFSQQVELVEFPLHWCINLPEVWTWKFAAKN